MGDHQTQARQSAEYRTTIDIAADGTVASRLDEVTPIVERDLPFGEAGEVFVMPCGEGGRMVISATNEQLWQRLLDAKLAELDAGGSIAE